MAFDSYRDFIGQLDRAGELKRISQPVATELEITELANREMKSPNGGKALLFEKPTINGEVSPFPLAINTMGSWKRMAMSMGADSVDAVAAELGSLMKAKPPTGFKEAIKLLGQALDLRHARPKVVKDGPCKETIHKFDAPAPVQSWPLAPQLAAEDPKVKIAIPIPSQLSVTSPPVPQVNKERILPSAFLLPTLLNLPIQKCWP